MNTEIENIIINHDFAELTAEQKIMVNEWAASEEEFVTMKQIISSAPLLNANVGPSPQLKASLMDTFAATHAAGAAMASGSANVQQKGKDKKVIYMWFRTGAAVAAIVFAVFLVYPLFNSNSEANLVAENKVEKKKQTESPIKTEDPKVDTDLDSEETLAGAQVENNNSVNVIPVAPQDQVSVAPTTGPLDGKALVSLEDAAAEMEDMILIEETSVASRLDYTTVFASPSTTATVSNFSNANGMINTNSGDGFTLGKSDVVGHSDRLAAADLPEHTRPIMQERPELFDLLHTSF